MLSLCSKLVCNECGRLHGLLLSNLHTDMAGKVSKVIRFLVLEWTVCCANHIMLIWCHSQPECTHYMTFIPQRHLFLCPSICSQWDYHRFNEQVAHGKNIIHGYNSQQLSTFGESLFISLTKLTGSYEYRRKLVNLTSNVTFWHYYKNTYRI